MLSATGTRHTSLSVGTPRFLELVSVSTEISCHSPLLHSLLRQPPGRSPPRHLKLPLFSLPGLVAPWRKDGSPPLNRPLRQRPPEKTRPGALLFEISFFLTGLVAYGIKIRNMAKIDNAFGHSRRRSDGPVSKRHFPGRGAVQGIEMLAAVRTAPLRTPTPDINQSFSHRRAAAGGKAAVRFKPPLLPATGAVYRVNVTILTGKIDYPTGDSRGSQWSVPTSPPLFWSVSIV